MNVGPGAAGARVDRTVRTAMLLLVIAMGWPRAAAPGPRKGGSDVVPLRVSVAARTIRPGELVVLTVRSRDATPLSSVGVRAFNAAAPVVQQPDGSWRALVGIDLDQAPGAYAITIDVPGRAPVTRPLIVRRRRFPTRRLTVDPDFVNPPPALAARIESESALLRDVYAHPSEDALWRGPFVRPVPGSTNSRFGTRSIFNGEPRNAHSGADFLSGAGTPIKAPNAGRIVVARTLFFSGNTVVIDHGRGLFSMLAHMSRIDVQEGQTVGAGEVVGLVGATGRVTGPHLHWALRVANARVDPGSALALLGARSSRQSPQQLSREDR